MGLLSLLTLGSMFIFAGLLAIVISFRWFRRDELSERMRDYVTEQPGTVRQLSPAVAVRNRELSGHLFARIFFPFFRRIGVVLSRVSPAGTIESTRRKLALAGNPYGVGAREYFGIRLIFLLIGIWLAIVFIRRDLTTTNITISLMSLLVTVLLPIIWLSSMVHARQDKIRRGLPDALDMLSVCADAGLGFDQSLQRVSEQWRTPVAIEMGRVVAEMEMGLSRKEALRNLANRLEVAELSSFVAVIIQSDQLGISIADTLHSQAEQMRIERRYRAQEVARTIPTKMLIPLAFLIFPAIMAVVLGPSVPSLLDLFSGL